MSPSVRQTNLLIFIICTAMMLAAAYMEHVMKMVPCSLCITQRGFVVLTGLLALIAAIHNPADSGRRAYAIAGILSAILGACFAGRQLWLQSLPEDQVPACGPGLAYMFEVFPFMDALKLLLQGDGNCAHVDKILGLSLAAWTLMAFIALAGVNLYQTLRSTRRAWA
ncbi:disulfide bond formation protein B [Cellvibrio mixtus]|uniref:Disulfide bond formation protein B n=1 Tax=Cellvibrio mixtus TaxID=39650 RepID=A0A266QBH3_9GAMM|nr:disulfide bond formation protein B [Cellvibrio mixtus]OZY87212.1 disulfide bond formation protein B [Cellvibrio mixtus]